MAVSFSGFSPWIYFVHKQTKAEPSGAAYKAQKQDVSDALPLFSQAQVLNLTGHFCDLILQPLRADREEEFHHRGTEDKLFIHRCFDLQ